MKTENEFLKGVYEKSEAFASGEKKPRGFEQPKQNHFKRYIGIAAAAVLIAVVAPSLYFSYSNASYEMYEPVSDKARINEPVAATLLASAVDVGELANSCDIVVLAQVKKIDKSVYEFSDTSHMTTTVSLKVNQYLKGDGDATIKIKVNGGYDQETSNFIPYEATFKKKENVVLFLVKTDGDEYALQNSAYGKYSEVKDPEQSDVYLSKDSETITIAEIIDRINYKGKVKE